MDLRRRVLLPVAVGAVQVVGSAVAARHGTGRRELDGLGYALLLVGPLALLVRDRAPVGVLVACGAATAAYYALDLPPGPAVASLIVAVVPAVVSGRRRPAAFVLAGVAATAWVSLLAQGRYHDVGGTVAASAWALVLLAFADKGRSRAERAQQLALAREAELQRRTTEERLRIAREVHDVVAHSISLINVQAGVALHLVETSADGAPEQVRQALATIKGASKDVLRDLRSTLGVLRRVDDDPDGDRSPAPGLRDLDRLVDGVEGAGLQVAVSTTGRVRPLPPGVELAAYRIVQESLTNAARHAPGSRTQVLLDYDDSVLRLRVSDDGAGASGAGGDGSGNGLVGMRERALALGGRLQAGAVPGGGFQVDAELPL